ncbi:MAG: Macrophage infectivity potentiator-related protein [Gemmatimonadetes bacterium]|nr:Macrophage infectivity potentiator-related protein [Gemmatimonadota bacterium]
MTSTLASDRAFPVLDESSAPSSAQRGLAAVRAQLGFLPDPIARYATAPTFLRIAQQSLHAFEGTSLDGVEREVVAFAVIRRNRCDFCTAFHKAVTLPTLGLDAAQVDAIVSGKPLADERLETLRQFTESALDNTGDVDDVIFASFLEAGYDRAQALEVVLGVGAYTMTTLANRLTQAVFG